MPNYKDLVDTVMLGNIPPLSMTLLTEPTTTTETSPASNLRLLAAWVFGFSL